MRRGTVGTHLLLGLALAACQAGAPAAEETLDRATMTQIADALSRALPRSLEEDQLDDPEVRAELQASLDALAESAGRLEQHGRSREASFAYLSRSLAHDARVARERLAAGQDAEAQFVVRQLVADCMACHSRLPDLDDSELGARLVARIDPQSLPLRERVRVQVATRQFDAALAGYEQLFQDPAVPPGQLDLQGQLLEYLNVSIRVKQDLRRPRLALERMAARPDVAEHLEEDLAAWVRALQELDDRPRVGDPGSAARALVQDAGLEDVPAYDRRGYVHALLASSLLHQQLETAPPSGAELAELYYLLGLTATRASRSLWLSEAEVYLDTAVRTAPESPTAARAYALLEQEVLAGYTGSAGLQLPEDVDERLRELRSLIEAAAPPADAGSER